MTASDQAETAGDRPRTEMDNRMEDAGDVVEGEVGSARLKEPARVEAEGARPASDTLPQGADDGPGRPTVAGRVPEVRGDR